MKEKILKMDFENKKFQKMFPNLSQEMKNSNCGIKINSVRSDFTSAENAVSKKFTNYTPDVIDFLRRCDNAEQAEEIICYLEMKQEITSEYAKKLRKQLKKSGVRSFGTKKENDYYLKSDSF
jgi:hypothetical protein